MNNYCSNCGNQLREQSKFCSNCGLNTKEQADAPQQSPAPAMPVQQQNTYNPEYGVYQQQNTYNPEYGVYQKTQTAPKFNYILFIFITSLIILLHFFSRTLDMMISTLTWDSFGYVLRLMITLAVFIVAITHFVAATNSFYKQNPMEKRANSAKKLSALSITMAVLSAVLLFIDIIVIFTIYLPLYERLYSGSYTSIFSYKGIITNAFMYQFVPILIYDIFFVVFAFINMVKSGRFKEVINNSYMNKSN